MNKTRLKILRRYNETTFYNYNGCSGIFPPSILAEAEGVKSAVEGNNELALDFYKELIPENAGKNAFFSPFSISTALAMAYAGARGNTATQMAEVLHFNFPQNEFHPAFSALISQIKVKPEEKSYELNIANALWGSGWLSFP